MKKALFLDRDGVINKEKNYYNGSLSIKVVKAKRTLS